MMARIVPLSVIVVFVSGLAILRAQPMVINEFMFAPSTGAAEWIELYNASDSPVNVRDWTLWDRGAKPVLITAEDILLPPGAFLILAAQLPIADVWAQLPCRALRLSGFPSLNNSGDDIVIRDATGLRVDSLAYTASWSTQRGVSAERIAYDTSPDQGNWAACANATGGTPGEENTALALNVDPLPRYALVVNEIMAAPLSTSCEWFELYNTTRDTLRLSRWAFAGKPNGKNERTVIQLPSASASIPPGGYAVIAADSGIFSSFPHLLTGEASSTIMLGRASLNLTNEEDEIVLYDPTGTVIDSIRYHVDWHHPLNASATGVSLELMNPLFHGSGKDAWSSCADPAGGTPGTRNSLHTDAPPGTVTGYAAISVTPVPFSPDGDGFEDSCIFRCRLPEHVHQVRLRLYDAEGRVITTLRNNSPMGNETLVVWDGLDDAGRRARIGCYVALLEGLDPAANVVVAAKTVVVVARRL